MKKIVLNFGLLFFVIQFNSCIIFEYFFESKFSNSQIYIESVNDNIVYKVSIDDGINGMPSFSKKGDKLVYHYFPKDKTKKRKILSYNLETKETNTLFESSNLIRSPMFTKDDKFIFYTEKTKSQADLYLYNIKSRKHIALTDDKKEEDKAIISSNGTFALFLQKDEKEDEQIFILYFATKEKKQITKIDGMLNKVQCFALSSNEKQIAYIRFLTLVVCDLSGKTIEEIDLTGLNSII